MSHEARIQRMRDDGVISARQAEMLRLSLGLRVDPPPRRRSRSAIFPVVAGLVGLGLVALVLGLGSGGDPGQDAVQIVSETMNEPGGPAMNKGLSTLFGALILLLVPIVLWTWLTNSLVAKEESVFSAWAQVESNYQRRSDLIPALIETTGRYLKHESATLTAVVAARSAPAPGVDEVVAELVRAQRESATQLGALGGEPPEDPERLAALAAAQAQVGLGMRKLLALAEAYPALRSADQFLELQAQLEGTENRINVARMRFNEDVRRYNAAIRKLPGNLIARANGFKRKAYFEADAGARDADPLQFD